MVAGPPGREGRSLNTGDLCARGQQTFTVKNQMVNFWALWAVWSQLIYSVTVAAEPSKIIHK